MKKIIRYAILLQFLAIALSAGAQPPPPGPPGKTTSVPIDSASLLVLTGAAILKWWKGKEEELDLC